MGGGDGRPTDPNAYAKKTFVITLVFAVGFIIAAVMTRFF